MISAKEVLEIVNKRKLYELNLLSVEEELEQRILAAAWTERKHLIILSKKDGELFDYVLDSCQELVSKGYKVTIAHRSTVALVEWKEEK